MDSHIDSNAIPETFDVTREGETLEIRISWRGGFLSAALFAACVSALSVWGVYKLIRSGDIASHLDGLALAIFIPVVLWGLAVVARVNTTSIRVTPERIVVASRPMPWLNDREVDSRTLRQTFVTEFRQRDNTSTETKYEVRAVRTNGENVAVVSGLLDVGEALLVQSLIDEHLGLPRARIQPAED